MTLTECNIYCIQYSNNNNNNSNNNNNKITNHNHIRVFNYSLVETSLQNKLSFMHEHKTFFLSNPRIGMLVHTFDKMSTDKQKTHLDNANNFLKELDNQN